MVLNCRAVEGSWILVNVWKALRAEPMICIIQMFAYYCYEMNALVLGEEGHAQAIRAWKISRSFGSQTLPRSGGKSFKFGILLLYIQGGNKKKFIFPRFCLIAPERKHFHCVVMIGNTCEPHPTQLSPFASLVSMSLPCPCSLLLIRKKPSRIWCFLPVLVGVSVVD